MESDSETSEIFARNKAAAFSERKERAVPENSESSESGGVLFSQHFYAGTRPFGGAKDWTNKTFIDALRPVTLDVKSLRNHLSGKNNPNLTNAIAYLKALFGNNPAHKIEREKLGRAWGVPESVLQALAPSAEPPVPTTPAPVPAPGSVPAPSQTAVVRPDTAKQRIMEWTLGTARQYETATTFGILAEFRIGVDHCRDIKGLIGMGVSRVYLEKQQVGCKPAAHVPRMGDGNSTGEGVVPGPHHWEIVAPEGKHLDLKILETLGVFERIQGEGPPTVTIAASAEKEHLVPIWRGPRPNLKRQQQAIIDQYLKHRGYRKSPKVDLGTDTVDGSPQAPTSQETKP